jgi:hypothetical protein
MLCGFVFCVFTVLMGMDFVCAQLSHTPEQLPGWPINLYSSLSQIIVADLDGDGRDEMIAGLGSEVHVINAAGENLPGWPQEGGSNWSDEITVVAAGDIDGDGDKEIVGIFEEHRDVSVFAWHFETGGLVEGWPVVISSSKSRHTDLVLGNFDDNPSDLEIAAADVDENYSYPSHLTIHVLNGDASYVDGWPRSFDINKLRQVYVSAGNIDNSGSDELVVACYHKEYLASSLYVFRGDGQIASGWPVEGNGSFMSPAVLCNLDDDDDFEIVAGTANRNLTGRIYAYNPDGTGVSGWPRDYNTFYLSVGDLNSDDRPEIIASYSNDIFYSTSLAVLDDYGRRLLSKGGGFSEGAITGNVDNDTDSEIIIPSRYDNLHVMDMDGEELRGFPVYMANGVYVHRSALGDLDGDGDTEIIQLEHTEISGNLLYAFDLEVPKSERPDWPMVRHDERRSSMWRPPQTAGWDIVEVFGPLEVMENSSTEYTLRAYFEDGSNDDVTSEADWRVDARYADYAHFESGGVLVTHDVAVFTDIIVYAEYVEGAFSESTSYEVRIRPTVQVLYVDDNSANDPGPNDPSISDPNEHGTEEHPFDTVQEAIDVVGSGYGDTVIVLPGTYNEYVKCQGKDFTLTGSNPNDAEIVAATVIINEGLREYHAVDASDGSLFGLTIRGGIKVGDYDTRKSYSPTISHCNIITSKNTGIHITVPYQTGPANVIIENNIISTEEGIGIYMSGQSFSFGGVEGIIRNNTLITNSGWAGINYSGHHSTPVVTNNIIYGFEYGICLARTIGLEEKTARIYYNNVYGNQENYHIGDPPTPLDLTGVNGNVSVDPVFVDYENGDLHLQDNSPCINAGDPDYIPEPGETELDGKPRVIGGRIDMGAYEFNQVPVANAGADVEVYAGAGGVVNVELDGSESSDADGQELTYSWTWEIDGEVKTASGVSPVVEFGRGEHVVTLVVNDGLEDSLSGEVVVKVLNVGPVADAGQDATVYAGIDGVASVELDGSGSSDVNGDALGYRWLLEGVEIGWGVNASVELAVGDYVVELVVFDGWDEDSDTLAVTVVGPIETRIRMFPRALNLASRGRGVWAIMDLPEGFDEGSVDWEYGVVLAPGGVKARLRRVSGSEGKWRVYAMFERARVIDAFESAESGEVTIVCRVLSGRYLYGVDEVKVVGKKVKENGKGRVSRGAGRVQGTTRSRR